VHESTVGKWLRQFGLTRSSAGPAVYCSGRWRPALPTLTACGACRLVRVPMLPGFVVTDAEAAAIRGAFEQRGEFSAAVELRRLFPGVTDNAEARECARMARDLD
jgi:hypothetical protein